MLVGLGNPGMEYKFTRHNSGFLFLDYLAEKFSLSFSFKKKLEAETAIWQNSDFGKIVLLKPLTFMNLSGNSVRKAANYHRVLPSRIIVAHDDLDLCFKVVRTRLKGSAGGHNGLKSIKDSLGVSEFKRIKIGISNEKLQELQTLKRRDQVVNFVLSKFKDNEIKVLPEIFDASLYGLSELLKTNTGKTYKVE